MRYPFILMARKTALGGRARAPHAPRHNKDKEKTQSGLRLASSFHHGGSIGPALPSAEQQTHRKMNRFGGETQMAVHVGSRAGAATVPGSPNHQRPQHKE